MRVANLCESEHACHPHQIRKALERFEIQLPGESGSEPIGKPVASKIAAAVVPQQSLVRLFNSTPDFAGKSIRVVGLRATSRSRPGAGRRYSHGTRAVGTAAYRPWDLHVPIFDGDMT
jgi:hypothetical protein